MRINKYLAQATGMSRRAADTAISAGRVTLNGQPAEPGMTVKTTDTVALDGAVMDAHVPTVTIMLNKPPGYVVSRNGQGSATVYDLLPETFQALKPVGRLDKDSSGLLLFTNDGQLANELTHPSRRKHKIYEVTLDKPLQPLHRQLIAEHGVNLEDGPSRFMLERRVDGDDHQWLVTMHEGRNRQIRRTFASLGYSVTRLHRIRFGDFLLEDLAVGETQPVKFLSEKYY